MRKTRAPVGPGRNARRASALIAIIDSLALKIISYLTEVSRKTSYRRCRLDQSVRSAGDYVVRPRIWVSTMRGTGLSHMNAKRRGIRADLHKPGPNSRRGGIVQGGLPTPRATAAAYQLRRPTGCVGSSCVISTTDGLAVTAPSGQSETESSTMPPSPGCCTGHRRRE